MPTPAAVVLSSVAFGFVHLAPRDFPQLTSLGILLGFSYVRCVSQRLARWAEHEIRAQLASLGILLGLTHVRRACRHAKFHECLLIFRASGLR